MKNNNDHIAISVESRKGGVGKTSVALHIARLLLNSGKYEVLFLDLDISGTDASTYVPSLKRQNIWKNNLHVVKSPFQTHKHSQLNLVTLFENYMSGISIPPVSWINEDEINDVFFFIPEKINIISSNLGRSSQKDRVSDPVYGPSILFDEIHSEWFISMLKDLVNNSCKLIPKKKKLAIIIDNSPGYSGLEPVVEQWLTDLGPEQGKFIFVSSVDTPDLLICIKSLNDINNLMMMKWDTSRKFFSMALRKEEGKISDSQRSFFNRLAETYSRCEKNKKYSGKCISCGLCFYREESDHWGLKYQENPVLSLAILMNKVPEPIYNEKYKLKIDNLFHYLGIKVEKDLTLDKVNKNFIKKTLKNVPEIIHVLAFLNKNKIPFKSDWSLQYCLDRIIQENVMGKNHSNERITKFIEKVSNEGFPEFYQYAKNLGLGNLSVKIQLINSFDIQLKKFFNELYRMGVDTERIYRIQDLFFEKSYEQLFKSVIGKFSISNFSDRGIEAQKIHKLSEYIVGDMNNFRNLLSGIEKKMILKGESNVFHDFIRQDGIRDICYDIATDLAIAKYWFGSLSGKNTQDESKSQDQIVLISILILLLNEKKLSARTALYQRGYWMTCLYKDRIAFESIYEIVSEYFGEHRLIGPESSHEGIQIYQDYCRIRLRLIDAPNDYNFIVKSLSTILLSPAITQTETEPIKFIRQVVREKKMSHYDGNNFLTDFLERQTPYERIEVFQKAEEYSEYHEVLNSILGKEQWDLL